MTQPNERYAEILRVARERLCRTNIADPALLACIRGLARIERVLRQPVRIVLLGEYNSGKTSVADLLIGNGVLPTSVVSTTRVPTTIEHSETAALHGISHDGTRIRIDIEREAPLADHPYRALEIALPLDRLRGYRILDTPSREAPAAFVADADIVVWCTVATRAWTESERAACTALPARCFRNALLVATHKDALQSLEDCEQVLDRLRSLTQGLFRDVVLVGADEVAGLDDDESAADDLRGAVARLAEALLEKRSRKAEKIVRRLARRTFHRFEGSNLKPDAVALIATWETQAGALLGLLAQGRRSVPETIQDLLVIYAYYAERLRPGVISGDSSETIGAKALTQPMRWPSGNAAAVRLVEVLASDLTGLLRMLAGASGRTDPAVQSDYRKARGIVLSLANLDGAFDALGKMLGASAGPVQVH